MTQSIHNAIRVGYLLAASAVLPLAILHVRSSCSGCVEGPYGFLLLGAMFVGGPVWAIFYIVSGQLFFPAEIKPALHLLLSLLLNGLFAFRAGASNLFFSAYTIMSATVIAQFLFFAIMSGLFIGKSKRSEYFSDTYDSYIFAPLLLAAFAGCFGILILRPGINLLTSSAGSLSSMLAFLFFCYDIANQTRHYFRSNMFLSRERSIPGEGEMDWKIPAALGLVVTVVASILIIIISSKANQ